MFSPVDINECAIETMVTCINSDCVNVDGNYTCSLCFPGFTREGEPTNPCGEAVCGDVLQ